MRKNILFTLGVLVVMSSCVNKDYDLTRPIDKTMNVGGRIEMPVPGESSYSYTLEEILMPKDASDGSGLLKKLDDGTFVLEVKPSAELNENYTFAALRLTIIQRLSSILRTTISIRQAPVSHGPKRRRPWMQRFRLISRFPGLTAAWRL